MDDIDASIGKNKMQKATTNNLFDIEAFSLKGETNHVSWHGAFYQQFVTKLISAVHNAETLQRAGQQLVAMADYALDLKQTDVVEQISRVMINAPLLRQYQSIGDYYQVFCLKRRGQLEQARAGFQRLAEWPSLPLKFRARAIQALGISYSERGDYDAAMPFFLQAAQAASPRHGNDLLTTVNVQLITAIARSVAGDHESSLRHLETLRPLVGMLAPHQLSPRYIYTNSLAVELAEVGRLQEARHLAEVGLRSPYSQHYPEYRETHTEILEKMRRAAPSVVGGISWPQEAREDKALPAAAHNVVAMPFAPRPAIAPIAGTVRPQLARVLAYHGWRQSLPKPSETLPETFTPGDLEQMSIADKQTALLTVIYGDDVTHDTLDQLLTAAGKVTTDTPTH
jgi:tetratricopeptide (TPR) repeat protein